MSRVQLALNVDDIDEAVTLCCKLLDTEPAKVRPGYANFAVCRPAAEARCFIENPGQWRDVNHLGVEVADVVTVDAEQTRLAAAGSPRSTSGARPAATPSRKVSGFEGTPDGERWEVYTVLADSQTFWEEPDAGAGCCGSSDRSVGEARAAACC